MAGYCFLARHHVFDHIVVYKRSISSTETMRCATSVATRTCASMGDTPGCGVAITRGSASNGCKTALSLMGSWLKTARATPARRPSGSAVRRDASSITPQPLLHQRLFSKTCASSFHCALVAITSRAASASASRSVCSGRPTVTRTKSCRPSSLGK